jgi:anthranilate phosphoribosyltransferase
VIETILGKVSGGQDLSRDEMASAMDGIMAGQWSDPQMALFLTALHHKGETVQEIAGAASALRQHMTPIQTRQTGLVDTCGTGGSRANTFNISTAAAIVTAAAGVPVAKHGNRSITSCSGSADVLAELGVNIQASVPVVEACLDELGLCFCFAPLLHPSMKHVSAVRRSLGFPTIFNILGPLANPAAASRQLIGVGRAELRNIIAEALVLLGTQRALVVHGEDGQDEVTLGGATYVTEATPSGVGEFTWHASDFDLPPVTLREIQVANPAESAAAIRAVLGGDHGPKRQVVVANAAAALWVAGKAETPAACARLAEAAIDDGRASRLLSELAQRSHEGASA